MGVTTRSMTRAMNAQQLQDVITSSEKQDLTSPTPTMSSEIPNTEDQNQLMVLNIFRNHVIDLFNIHKRNIFANNVIEDNDVSEICENVREKLVYFNDQDWSNRDNEKKQTFENILKFVCFGPPCALALGSRFFDVVRIKYHEYLEISWMDEDLARLVWPVIYGPEIPYDSFNQNWHPRESHLNVIVNHCKKYNLLSKEKTSLLEVVQEMQETQEVQDIQKVEEIQEVQEIQEDMDTSL